MNEKHLLNLVSGTASATDTNNATIIAAPTAGDNRNQRLIITDIIISNSSATATEVAIKDGTTTKLTYPAPPDSGAIHSLQSPLKLSVGAALAFASADGVTTMKVSALGYIK